MVFSSIPFLFFFLPAVLLGYFLAPARFRNFVLLLFSLLFYSWGEPVYLFLMLFSTLFDYCNGLLIDRFRAEKKERWALGVLISSIVVNLGILAYFKYFGFFVRNLNQLPGIHLPLAEAALPIGISFYTFQTLSYTIDVYRGRVSAQRQLLPFAVYVAMFPQLVAGPIVQYKDIEPCLGNRQITAEGFAYGIRRFVAGLGKKVLLANRAGMLWEEISGGAPEHLSVCGAWLGAIAFSFQIYFDFSGYSDMAIGLGEMFGFHFRENFRYPYGAGSITEFWRRWHISLGAWFREYVYIPLGGNRRGLPVQIRNILLVWALTGFWHGASWNFVLWGLYYGILLVLEKAVLLRYLSRRRILSHVYTLFFVVIGWVLFALEELPAVWEYLKAMFGVNGNPFWSDTVQYHFGNNALLFLALCLCCVEIPEGRKRLRPVFGGSYLRGAVSCLGYGMVFLLSVCFLVGEGYNPFLYFRF